MDFARTDDHYHTLGVPEDASPEEVRHAYKSLLLVVHPDKAVKSPLSASESTSAAGSASLLARIQEAYAVLKDPVLRGEYDESLRERRMFEEHADVYEEVRISDLAPSADGSLLTHPCRCGDLFALDAVCCSDTAQGDTGAGDERVEYMLACPSCSLHLIVFR
jgi:curved DNA-binding protein CbpA|mmetsp:Transcript_13292/g.38613  ORF Transcript_13292/g.38613 Transcript_13292/m.38613 type:complete len:163 (+) Transcript_13292:246-734(+)